MLYRITLNPSDKDATVALYMLTFEMPLKNHPTYTGLSLVFMLISNPRKISTHREDGCSKREIELKGKREAARNK